MLIPIGNDHQPLEFGPSIGRTAFQDGVVKFIAKAMKDFDFFCGSPMCDEFYRGPVCILWYDKQGRLNVWSVGTKSILRIVWGVS